jgi:hypothetical protein
MEQLFNPGLDGSGHPEIQLCIFPHLREFLVFDSRDGQPQVLLLNADDVLGEEFYRAVEIEFSEALRESNDFPFSHLINLPMHIEETVRDVAMTFILDQLGVQVDDEEEIPGVVVYVVSGGALATHTELVLEGLKELLHTNFDENFVSQWEQKIGEMISEETSTLERLNRKQITEALKGDSPDYFTLWESRN